MMTVALFHLIAASASPLAAGQRGGRAAIWIGGWLVVLLIVVGIAVYLARRGGRRDDHRSGGKRWP
jgi:hypothetical protein